MSVRRGTVPTAESPRAADDLATGFRNAQVFTVEHEVELGGFRGGDEMSVSTKLDQIIGLGMRPRNGFSDTV